MFIERLNCLFLSLGILHLSMLSEGRPLRKRSVTEVQLMHNQGVHKHVHERQEWLNKRLQNIHTVPLPAASSQHGEERSAAVAAGPAGGPPGDSHKTHRERRLLPGGEENSHTAAGAGHHQQPDLTPEQMDFALSFLERLLDSSKN